MNTDRFPRRWRLSIGDYKRSEETNSGIRRSGPGREDAAIMFVNDVAIQYMHHN